jgi:flagellar basal-body rod protein FlgG
MRALFISASGMKSQQINIDVISNNLANVNTDGFKRGRADFEDMLYQTLRPVGASAAVTEVPTGIYLGLGSKPSSTSKVFSQGPGRITEKSTDISIEGAGFFQIEMPDGRTAYTRNGSFNIDSNGAMVTNGGNPLSPAITFPTTVDRNTIFVAPDGTVSYRVDGATDAPQEAGQIQLVRFINPPGLEAIGGNLFLETGTSGTPTVGTPSENGFGSTASGMLEGSNVQIVDELVGMIWGQRAYEINSKGIQVADEMLETAVNVKR